jgi:hypothetical protein
MSTPTLVTASTSKITIDGKDVPGVQSIEFKVNSNATNIHSITTDERIGAYYGGVNVEGSLKVRSLFAELDKKMYETLPQLKHFQIVIELHPQGEDAIKKKISIDEAYLTGKAFGIDATGVGVTTYNFTGTRISEE